MSKLAHYFLQVCHLLPKWVCLGNSWSAFCYGKWILGQQWCGESKVCQDLAGMWQGGTAPASEWQEQGVKAPVTAQPLKPIGRSQEDLNSQCKSFKDCHVFFFHFLAIFKLNHLLDDFSLKISMALFQPWPPWRSEVKISWASWRVNWRLPWPSLPGSCKWWGCPVFLGWNTKRTNRWHLSGPTRWQETFVTLVAICSYTKINRCKLRFKVVSYCFVKMPCLDLGAAWSFECAQVTNMSSDTVRALEPVWLDP